MRRLALILVCLLTTFGVAAAEGPRIELGLGGYFPLGGWTRCRISGLEGVADGERVVLYVGDKFSRELTVTGGAAEGLALMTEELPRISITLPDGTTSELPGEATRRLRAIKDCVPTLFIGQGHAEWPETTMRMTPTEFAARDVTDLEWVRSFVLGDMTSTELAQMKANLLPLVRLKGASLVRKGEITGWLRALPFMRGSTVYSVCRSEQLPAFPEPTGSVRPELYGIFGPPEWPASARSNIAAGFVFVLLLTAVSLVLPERFRWLRWYRLVFLVAAGVGVTWLVTWQVRTPTESVRIVKRISGVRQGIGTHIVSRAILRRGPGGHDRVVVTDSLTQPTPVAYRRADWMVRPLFVDAQNVLQRETSVPGREVFVEVGLETVTEPTEGLIVTDGRKVWTDADQPAPPADARSFDDYVEETHHDDPRVEALRDATLKYWKHTHTAGWCRLLGWTPAERKPRRLFAGTLVVSDLVPGAITLTPDAD